MENKGFEDNMAFVFLKLSPLIFVIKRFADRARALGDEKHLAEELHNIEDVFVANGYPRKTVRRFMERRP